MAAWRGTCSAFGLLFVLSVCPKAAAQPRVAIEWVAPSDCGPETMLVAEIERLLGRSIEDAATSLRARVEILPGPPWTMRLVIETAGGPAGERRLEGDTCSEVASAAAIVLALAIDPSAAERIAAAPAVATPSPTPPTPPPAPAPPVPPVTPPGPLVRPPPPRRRPIRAPRAAGVPARRARPAQTRAAESAPATGAAEHGPALHVSAFAGGGLALGTVPGASAVGLAGAALSVGRVRVEASFLYAFPSEERLDDGRDGGGRFDLLTAGIDGCLTWALGRWEPRGCVGAEVGSLRGSAFGVSSPGEGDALWVAARATAGLAWSPVPAFRLWVALSGIVPIERPRFVVEGRGAVYRPDVVAARALLGVELRFR